MEKGSGKCFEDKWFCCLKCRENYLKENDEFINIYYSDNSSQNHDHDRDRDQLEDNMDYSNHHQENISNSSEEADAFIPKINYDPMEDF